MPELPEVETIVRGLQSIVNSSIVHIDTSASKGLIKSGTEEGFKITLLDSQVKLIRRFGKWIRFDCQLGDDHPVLLSHLGMFGSWLKGGALGPHARLTLDLDGPQGGTRLTYSDMRSWGRLYAFTKPEADKFMEGRVGIDALDVTQSHLELMLRAYTGPVVEFLLDQGRLAGIGNIYRSEILHQAGIAPDRPCTDLDVSEISSLSSSIKNVLDSAIERRGSSISDYVDTDGNKGSAHLHLKAYGRDGKACITCRSDIIRLSKDFDRTVYFCPKCQH